MKAFELCYFVINYKYGLYSEGAPDPEQEVAVKEEGWMDLEGDYFKVSKPIVKSIFF